MSKPAPKPPATPPAPKNGPLGLRRKPDHGSGRPLTPTPKAADDGRVAESKSWSETARAAARQAFEAARAAGASREEAISAGHEAGLLRHLEESGPPGGAELVARAKSLFGARLIAVLPPADDPTSLEERCFERLLPNRPFPPPAAAAVTPPRRKDSGDEDKQATPEEAPRAGRDELTRQATFNLRAGDDPRAVDGAREERARRPGESSGPLRSAAGDGLGNTGDRARGRARST